MTEQNHTLSELFEASNDDGPVFDAPWQARAFGVIVALHDAGSGFDWGTFQERLIEEVAAEDVDMAPAEALQTAYYEQWLAALERLLVEDGHLSTGEIDTRAAEFARGQRTAEEFVRGVDQH